MHSALIRRGKEAITEELITCCKTQGVVCIRQLFSPEELERLTSGIDQNLKNLSPRAKVASRPDDPGYFVEDFCNWRENKHFAQFIFNTPVSVAAGLLMESNTVRLYHDHLLVKEPNTRQATPWHQDQPYYNIDGRQNCSFWIPVDPVERKVTLEFVAGSHLGKWFMPRTFMDRHAKWFPEGSLAEVPEIESARDQFPIVGWELEPGDAVCFHMLTLHSAPGTESSRRRRVFSLRLLGDDIRHAPRPWMTSPEFPGLREELADQAPMEHPLFPLLWERKK